MERITFRTTKGQLDGVEQLVDAGDYPNRSEAIRHAVRKMLREEHPDSPDDSETVRKHSYAGYARGDD